jgi:hypothetical protein
MVNVETDRRDIVWLIARAEAVRRADAVAVAAIHLALLTIAFLAIASLVSSAPSLGVHLPSLSGPSLLVARLTLLAMAGWVFLSSWRRSAATRDAELRLLSSELHTIQQRMTYS